jgi:hypothetical protein
MVKKKTSINIDDQVWKDWMKFVIDKTGSVRRLSEEMENALREYMERHEAKD